VETKNEIEWSLSLSAAKCIERSRGDHEELLSEFNSLLAGVEATLQATGMSIRRMTHQDLFLEIKRSLHPLGNDTLPVPSGERVTLVRECEKPAANVNIEDEQDDYLRSLACLFLD